MIWCCERRCIQTGCFFLLRIPDRFGYLQFNQSRNSQGNPCYDKQCDELSTWDWSFETAHSVLSMPMLRMIHQRRGGTYRFWNSTIPVRIAVPASAFPVRNFIVDSRKWSVLEMSFVTGELQAATVLAFALPVDDVYFIAGTGYKICQPACL